MVKDDKNDLWLFKKLFKKQLEFSKNVQGELRHA